MKDKMVHIRAIRIFVVFEIKCFLKRSVFVLGNVTKRRKLYLHSRVGGKIQCSGWDVERAALYRDTSEVFRFSCMSRLEFEILSTRLMIAFTFWNLTLVTLHQAGYAYDKTGYKRDL